MKWWEPIVVILPEVLFLVVVVGWVAWQTVSVTLHWWRCRRRIKEIERCYGRSQPGS